MGSGRREGDGELPEEETNSLLLTSPEGGEGEDVSQLMIASPRKIVDEEDLDEKPAKRTLTSFELFGLSCYWFGWSALMGPLLVAVLPDQINGFPMADEGKGAALADTLVWGSALAIVVAPLAGSLSDSSTHRWGRRSPYIATGVVIASFALLVMAIAPSLAIYKFAFLLLSAANNVAMSPYTALVPDLVPAQQRGKASAWLGVMSLLGTLMGGGVTYVFSSIYSLYLVLGLLHAGSAFMTMRFCRERCIVRNRPPTFCGRCYSLIRPVLNHDFRVMFSTRFLMQMGILTIQENMLFFLGDVIQDYTFMGNKVAKSARQAVTVMFLPILIGAMGSACVAGIYADRTGKRKAVVYASGGVMMLSCFLFIVIDNFFFAVVAAFIFGLGYGAFSVIEWAMATDLLPNPEEYAKDMGIWSLALVLPQVVAGKIAGLIADNFKEDGKTTHFGYRMLFLVAMLYFIVGTVYVKRIQALT